MQPDPGRSEPDCGGQGAGWPPAGSLGQLGHAGMGWPWPWGRFVLRGGPATRVSSVREERRRPEVPTAFAASRPGRGGRGGHAGSTVHCLALPSVRAPAPEPRAPRTPGTADVKTGSCPWKAGPACGQGLPSCLPGPCPPAGELEGAAAHEARAAWVTVPISSVLSSWSLATGQVSRSLRHRPGGHGFWGTQDWPCEAWAASVRTAAGVPGGQQRCAGPRAGRASAGTSGREPGTAG